MFWRLLLVPALLAAAPAGGQAAPTRDPFAVVGEFVGRFSRISAGPVAITAACAPELGNAVGNVRDAAAARAAAEKVRPCLGRIRAAYGDAVEALKTFGPIPAEVQAASQVDFTALVEAQRKQFAAALEYMDDLDAFLGKMASDDRAGAMRLFPKIRAGGAALADGDILLLRAAQATSRFEAIRSAVALRIVVAEAAKLPSTAAVSQAGFAIGGGLSALAPRARDAASGVRSGWEQDQGTLRQLVRGHDSIEPLIKSASPMIEGIAASGDRIAVAFEQAGRRPVVPASEMVAMLNDLNRQELTLATSIQDFAKTLQTIGK